MKVVRDKSGEYPDCGYRYLDFERFSDESSNVAFFYGYASGRNINLIKQHAEHKRIFYQGEQPCGFYSLDDNERINSLRIGNVFHEVPSTSIKILFFRRFVCFKHLNQIIERIKITGRS